MSGHEEDYEHIQHCDANGSQKTPPRDAAGEPSDKTPVTKVNSLNDSGLFSDMESSSPITTASQPSFGVTEPVQASSADQIPPRGSAPMSPHAGEEVPSSASFPAKYPQESTSSKDKPAKAAVPAPIGASPPQRAVAAPTIAPNLPLLCDGCEYDVTKLYPYLNWEDPIKTGMLFVAGLLGFFVLFILRIRLWSFVAHAFLFAGVLTGIATGLKAHNVPMLNDWLAKLQCDAACVNELPKKFAAGFERVATRLIAIGSDVLSWQSPIRSLKALAGVWLLAHQGCCCFGKFPLFLAFVTVFTFPLAHTHYRAQIDNFYQNKVKKQLITAADVSASLQKNTTLVNGLLVAVLGGIIWIVFFPLSAWISLVSAAFLAVQTLPRFKPKTQ